jgi:surface antigen
MFIPSLALALQALAQPAPVPSVDVIKPHLELRIESPAFPSPAEIAIGCEATPSCLALRQEDARQAEIKRIKDLSESTLYPDTRGNSYAPGNCTWYVASRRSVGEFWGNANNWYYVAQSLGYETGDKPFRGAIAYTAAGWAGHVALVESVDGEWVTISEMNYNGWLYQVNVRQVHYTEFLYIYG